MEYGIHFCEHCGGELYNGRCMECGRTYQTSSNNTEGESILFNRHKENTNSPAVNPANDRKYAKIFASPKEHFVCALGNSYLQSFVSGGGLKNGFAVMSDKRIYFMGNTFYFDHKNKLHGQSESKTVDIKDVTGTSVREYDPLHATILSAFLFIIGAICLVAALFTKGATLPFAGMGIIGGILMLIVGKILKTDLLRIEFAGGCIAFMLKFYSRVECNEFQRQLRIVKDKLIEESENAAANAMRSAVETLAQQPVVQQPIIQQPIVQQPVAAADELLKYAQLVEKGLMTQAEFAEIKAKILANN